MSYIPVDPREEQRGVLRRAAVEFMRRSGEFLDQTAQYGISFDADELGVRIGVRSIRALQVLEALPQSVFRGFQPHGFWYGDDGFVWARFGYL